MNVKWFSDHKQFIRDQCLEHSNVSKESEYTEKLFLVKLHHRVNRGLNTWTDLYVLWRGDSIHRKHFMKRKKTQFLTSMSWILMLDVKICWKNESTMSLKIKISSPKWRECINGKRMHTTPGKNRSFWLSAKKSFSFWMK